MDETNYVARPWVSHLVSRVATPGPSNACCWNSAPTTCFPSLHAQRSISQQNSKDGGPVDMNVVSTTGSSAKLL